MIRIEGRIATDFDVILRSYIAAASASGREIKMMNADRVVGSTV